jgi:hypothetical protein
MFEHSFDILIVPRVAAQDLRLKISESIVTTTHHAKENVEHVELARSGHFTLRITFRIAISLLAHFVYLPLVMQSVVIPVGIGAWRLRTACLSRHDDLVDAEDRPDRLGRQLDRP